MEGTPSPSSKRADPVSLRVAEQTDRGRRVGWLSLRWRAVLLILVAAAPVFLVQVWQELRERDERRALVAEQVRQLASLLAEQQDRFVESARAVLAAATQAASVQDLDAEGCRRFFQRLLAQMPDALGLGAVDRDGVSFCTASGEGIGTNLSDRPYVQRALAGKELGVSRLIVGRVASVPVLNFAYPILGPTGEVRGAAILVFSVEHLSQILARTELPSGSSVELVDDAGVVVTRFPDPEAWIGKSVLGTQVDVVRRNGAAASVAVGLDGVRRFHHAVAVAPPANLAVIVGIPEDRVFAAADASFVDALVMLTGVFVLAGLIGLLGAELMIRRPIAALRGSVARIEAGELDGPPAIPSRWSAAELIGLAGSFGEMSRTLRARDAELRGLAGRLEQQVVERTRQVVATNERLRAEINQRQEAEYALRQSQKMEAIGQLTGGIAHDFNNLLQVILGSLRALQRRAARGPIPEGDPTFRRWTDAGIDGAERAARLTQRLLAFSRQQALQPAIVDLNKLVVDLSDLLRRTLGEAIEVETTLAGDLWRTHIDAHQLENALLNLVINARDAMPDGGRLTIATGNAVLDDGDAAAHAEVTAGEYVLLSVTDTGTGMTPDVVARAFDPFFTTKKVGQGSGLGLSMVYGFVKQSRGHVEIVSVPGDGTTVRVYLPRLPDGLAVEPELARADPREEVPVARSGEAVLVVEDDASVRAIVAATLEELGYQVALAASGPEALAALDAGAAVDLLFTDVGLPGMNGRKLVEAARQRRPGLKVLLTTGYTPGAVLQDPTLDPDVQLITKPFSLDALARRVRQVIGG